MFDINYELKEALKRIEASEALGMLKERQITIISAVSIALQMDLTAGFRTIGDANSEVTNTTPSFPIPEWAGNVIAYIVLPTGEISYFLNQATESWGGYTRQEKLERIRKFLNDDYEMPNNVDFFDTDLN